MPIKAAKCSSAVDKQRKKIIRELELHKRPFSFASNRIDRGRSAGRVLLTRFFCAVEMRQAGIETKIACTQFYIAALRCVFISLPDGFAFSVYSYLFFFSVSYLPSLAFLRVSSFLADVPYAQTCQRGTKHPHLLSTFRSFS